MVLPGCEDIRATAESKGIFQVLRDAGAGPRHEVVYHRRLELW